MSSSTASECEPSETTGRTGQKNRRAAPRDTLLWAARSSIRREDGSIVLSAQREAVHDQCFIRQPQERFRLEDVARGGASGVPVVILPAMRRLLTALLGAAASIGASFGEASA